MILNQVHTLKQPGQKYMGTNVAARLEESEKAIQILFELSRVASKQSHFVDQQVQMQVQPTVVIEPRIVAGSSDAVEPLIASPIIPIKPSDHEYAIPPSSHTGPTKLGDMVYHSIALLERSEYKSLKRKLCLASTCHALTQCR